MPARNDRSAILRGMRAAEKLHRDLGSRRAMGASVRVDVYSAIAKSGALLMFKPLDPLLGAFLREGDARGIMVTSRRPIGVQRFTAGHELGHLVMNHTPHADGEDILRRAPIEGSNRGVPIQEREADAFASNFLLPKHALAKLQIQQSWKPPDYENPHTIYQASLRFGASYRATVQAYEREKVIDRQKRVALLKVPPRKMKAELVNGHAVDTWANRDVWRLTEKDEGVVIEAGRDDLFVLKLREHRGSGYLWTFNELERAGFVILTDQVEAIYPGRIGGPKRRWVLGETGELEEGSYTLRERRPWISDEVAHSMTLHYQRSPGREDGLYAPQLDLSLRAG